MVDCSETQSVDGKTWSDSCNGNQCEAQQSRYLVVVSRKCIACTLYGFASYIDIDYAGFEVFDGGVVTRVLLLYWVMLSDFDGTQNVGTLRLVDAYLSAGG